MTRRVAAAGCGIGVAVGWNFANIGAIAEGVARDYGIGLATVGLFTTALVATHSVMQIPGGRASDAFGAGRVGLAALAVLAVSDGLALIASDPALGLLARALAGIGTGAGFVAASDYIRAAGGSSLAQGLFGGVAMGGAGLALAIAPQLEGWLGWRTPFASGLVLALGAALLLLASSGARSPTGVRKPPSGGPRRGVVTDLGLYRLGAMHAASMGLSLVVGNWAVTLLVRGGDYAAGAAGVVAGLVLLAGMLTRPLGGLVARRNPERIRPLLAVTLVAGACGTLALALVPPLPLAVVAASVIGLAAGVPFAPSFTGAAVLRPDAPAAAVGFVNMSGNLMVLVGTPLLGLAFALPGEGRIGFFAVAALWASALLLIPSARELGVARPEPLTLASGRSAQ